MVQPEPMEKTANVGAVHDGAPLGQFNAQLVQRQFAVLGQPSAHPVPMHIQFAATEMALS